MDRGAWWATVHGVAELDVMERQQSTAALLTAQPRTLPVQVPPASSMFGSKSGKLLVIQGKHQDYWKD